RSSDGGASGATAVDAATARGRLKSPRPGRRYDGVGSLVPKPRVEGVKRAQGVPVRGEQEIDEAGEGDVEGKATPELARGHAEHRLQVTPEALGRGEVQPIGDIGDGKARILE